MVRAKTRLPFLLALLLACPVAVAGHEDACLTPENEITTEEAHLSKIRDDIKGVRKKLTAEIANKGPGVNQLKGKIQRLQRDEADYEGIIQRKKAAYEATCGSSL